MLPAMVWRKAKRCHGDRATKENLFLLLLRQQLSTVERWGISGGIEGRITRSREIEGDMMRGVALPSEAQRCKLRYRRHLGPDWAGAPSSMREERVCGSAQTKLLSSQKAALSEVKTK